MRSLSHLGAAALVAAIGITALSIAAFGAQTYRVSQKGRAFQPGSIVIRRGETVEIINDDGDLLHHAYVDAPGFTFDSGDQDPGEKTQIVFSVPGTFLVLCGIHPKMKLAVRVEDR